MWKKFSIWVSGNSPGAASSTLWPAARSNRKWLFLPGANGRRESKRIQRCQIRSSNTLNFYTILGYKRTLIIFVHFNLTASFILIANVATLTKRGRKEGRKEEEEGWERGSEEFRCGVKGGKWLSTEQPPTKNYYFSLRWMARFFPATEAHHRIIWKIILMFPVDTKGNFLPDTVVLIFFLVPAQFWSRSVVVLFHAFVPFWRCDTGYGKQAP